MTTHVRQFAGSPKIAVDAVGSPQHFADTHRALTYHLQSARHRLGWLGLLIPDPEIDAASAAAVARMEALQRDLPALIPDPATMPREALYELLRQARPDVSVRWTPKI